MITVPLVFHVSADVAKLKRRLQNEGIADISGRGYDAYLRSNLWKKIRDWVLERDDFSCAVCAHKRVNASLQEFDVHHRDYATTTLEGCNDGQLVTVCRQCHKKIEFLPNGEKRISLSKKEAEFQRLIALHQTVVSDGMAVQVTKTARKGGATYHVAYLGPADYCEFYTLDGLMYRFTLDLFFKHRDALKIPLPFGREKLRQLSGANVRDSSSNKSIVNVACTDSTATVKVSSQCAIPVMQHLLKVIEESRPWRIII